MTDDHVTRVPERSRSLRALGLVTGIVALGAAGCVVEHDHMHAPDSQTPACLPPGIPAATVGIDANEPLASPPGEGAGVFLEYQAGGHWHVWTACDTKTSGLACNYDVFAQVTNGSTSNVASESLESNDAVYWSCTDTAELVATTTNDIDGMYFDAPPGAGVQFDVRIDGVPHPELVYWYGNYRNGSESYVHYGAPGNPVLVVPNTP